MGSELFDAYVKTAPEYSGEQITLGDIMENGDIEEKYFIDESG